MRYSYRTQGTCSQLIEFDVEDDVIHNVQFTGGCNGNLKAVAVLTEGLTTEQVEEKLGGIRCGFKSTSCGDQFARAVHAAREAEARRKAETGAEKEGAAK